ncbi:MAG TPA: IPT/TIG domain-containing protein [Terriglobales bacterium]|jgi:hypothetical protein
MKFFSLVILLLTAFTLGCGYKSPATTAPAAGVTPAIAQLVPATATHGAPGFTLTINGSNFASDSSANWNGTAFTTTFVTANQVTIAVPASAISSAGTASVVVSNPAVSGGIYGGGTLAENSNAMTFTIN